MKGGRGETERRTRKRNAKQAAFGNSPKRGKQQVMIMEFVGRPNCALIKLSADIEDRKPREKNKRQPESRAKRITQNSDSDEDHTETNKKANKKDKRPNKRSKIKHDADPLEDILGDEESEDGTVGDDVKEEDDFLTDIQGELNNLAEILDGTKELKQATRGVPKNAKRGGLDDDILNETCMTVKRTDRMALSYRRKRPQAARSARTAPQEKYSLDELLAEQTERGPSLDLAQLALDDETVASDEALLLDNNADEQLTNDKYGSDTVPVPVFVHWPKALPTPVYTPAAPTGTGTPLDSGLTQDGVQQILLERGFIHRYYSQPHIGATALTACPDNVLSWLFETVAYATNPTLAREAWHTLQNIIKTYTANSWQLRWVPTYNDFLRIFETYGAETGNSNKPSENTIQLTQDDPALTFPIHNFVYVIRCIGLCVNLCPGCHQEWQIIELVQWMCKFLFDPVIIAAVPDVHETLRQLLLYFVNKGIWESQQGRLVRALGEPTVAKHHPNQVAIILALPYDQQCSSLRPALAFHLLHNHYSLGTSTSNVSESVSESLQNIAHSIDITPQTDYSQICTLIALMDVCLSTHGALKSATQLSTLKQTFKSLNHQIREVRGYNLMITKAKDMLTMLIYKIDLLHTRNRRLSSDIRRYVKS